jgi:hypothetical protein
MEKAMNWWRARRFASIHFAIAIILVTWETAPRYSTEKIHSANARPALQFAAYQEEGGTVEFTPICEMWRSLSWQEKVLGFSEFPASVISGWNSDCPAAWTTAGMIGIDMRHHSLSKAIASSIVYCLLVGFQWLILGGLPLIRPHRWWLESGACNTACTVIAVLCGSVTSGLDQIASEGALLVFGVPAFLLLIVIFLTWPAWLVLLIWKGALSGWKHAASMKRKSA